MKRADSFPTREFRCTFTRSSHCTFMGDADYMFAPVNVTSFNELTNRILCPSHKTREEKKGDGIEYDKVSAIIKILKGKVVLFHHIPEIPREVFEVPDDNNRAEKIRKHYKRRATSLKYGKRDQSTKARFR